MTIPRCVKTADEAIAILKEQHARWQDTVARPSGEVQGNEPIPYRKTPPIDSDPPQGA